MNKSCLKWFCFASVFHYPSICPFCYTGISCYLKYKPEWIWLSNLKCLTNALGHRVTCSNLLSPGDRYIIVDLQRTQYNFPVYRIIVKTTDYFIAFNFEALMRREVMAVMLECVRITCITKKIVSVHPIFHYLVNKWVFTKSFCKLMFVATM